MTLTIHTAPDNHEMILVRADRYRQGRNGALIAIDSEVVIARHLRWTCLLLLALYPGAARADTLVRKPTESDDTLMSRAAQNAGELAQKVVHSNEIAGGKPTLIGFVNAPDYNVIGHLLIERTRDHYEHVSFPSCDDEGGPPQLMAVFFARTVKGAGRDLAVLCTWEHGGQAQNGTVYAAEFYRIDASGSKTTVTRLTDLNRKFVTSDIAEVNKHGKWITTGKATFKTVADVKKLLMKMGLPQ